jgi:GDP-D-mannose 3', 5'-epimerase
LARRALVAGGGGFIGHSLVSRLRASGQWVRAVDLHDPYFEPTQANEFQRLDLREYANCLEAVRDVDDVYQLAADMGGIGYITKNHAELTRNNTLINAHMLEASRRAGVKRYLFTSSACVYPSFKQDDPDVTPLTEADAIPADPEKGYGWEKLFTEQLTRYYHEEFGLDCRIVRFHNIYGPLGTFEGGREKAPAALSRKVAEAEDHTSIEVWGDGNQTRSFCFISDCVDGLIRLMDSGHTEPINLGSDELVSVVDLARTIVQISGKELGLEMNPGRPQGVRGRNSDNRRLREVLGWEPEVSLRAGLAKTYDWIYRQLTAVGRARPPVVSASIRIPTISSPAAPEQVAVGAMAQSAGPGIGFARF